MLSLLHSLNEWGTLGRMLHPSAHVLHLVGLLQRATTPAHHSFWCITPTPKWPRISEARSSASRSARSTSIGHSPPYLPVFIASNLSANARNIPALASAPSSISSSSSP